MPKKPELSFIYIKNSPISFFITTFLESLDFRKFDDLGLILIQINCLLAGYTNKLLRYLPYTKYFAWTNL